MRIIFKQFLTRDFKSPLNLIFVNFYYAVYSSSSLQFSPGHPLYEKILQKTRTKNRRISSMQTCFTQQDARRADSISAGTPSIWTKSCRKREQKIDFSTEFLPLMQLKTCQYRLWGRFAPLGRALRARVGIVIFCKLRKHSDARFARILVLSSK